MKLFHTKISRVIFLLGILASFFTIHFTSAIDRGGVTLHDLFKSFGERPWVILIYLALIFIPAFVASVVIPWSIRWVKSGI